MTGASVPGPGQGALGRALRRALAGYRRRMDQELAAAGFADRRRPEGRVLLMCSGPGKTTISDIARGLGITRQGASKIVAGLKERGYVDVTPSSADGREKVLTLTRQADQYLLALHASATVIEARLRDEIGADAVRYLFQVLDAVAGGAAVLPEDRPGEPPGIRALRWQEDEDQS
jgi:DNA-binding MarR family transcriptional regulator